MNRFKARSFFLFFILSMFCGVFVVRLATIQIFNRHNYQLRSESQSRSRQILPAQRGAILDRKGRVLAHNNTSAQTRQTGMQRLYPYATLAGTTLGYMGADGHGKGGIEMQFDELLSGEPGWAILQKDGQQRKIPSAYLPAKPPVHGSDLHLTLDVDVQKILQTELLQAQKRHGAKAAMGIVMEVKTGNVLAMSSTPEFDPNYPARYPLSMRRNKCITENFEPGSTFKLVTAAGIIENKILSIQDSVNGNNGYFEIYGERIRDLHPHNKLSFADAFAYSSNVCFAKMANQLGNAPLYTFALNFGFGSQSGIELPAEENGIVHPLSQWSGRTRVTMAIGQEISATLMQMTMLYAAIGNGGILLQPRIVQSSGSGGEKQGESDAVAVRKVVSSKTADILLMLMREVVSRGTAQRAQVSGLDIGGKTGTAQKIDKENGGYSSIAHYASFIGLVPVSNPKLVIAIVIDEPADGAGGGAASAPVFASVVQRLISHPSLEFGATIVGTSPEEKKSVYQIPDVCNLGVEQARAELAQLGIEADVIGSGSVVHHQLPFAGKTVLQPQSVKLYTDEYKKRLEIGRMPDVTGKDLSEAVNIVHLLGLKPFIQGAGWVTKQRPAASELVATAQPCTLYCAFDM